MTIKNNENSLIINLVDFDCSKYTADFLGKVKHYCTDIVDAIRANLKERMIPIMEERGEWMTTQEIADALGISQSCAKDWLAYHIWTAGNQTVCDSTKHRMFEAGLTDRRVFQLSNNILVLEAKRRNSKYYLRTKCDENGNPIGESKKYYYTYWTTAYKVVDASKNSY